MLLWLQFWEGTPIRTAATTTLFQLTRVLLQPQQHFPRQTSLSLKNIQSTKDLLLEHPKPPSLRASKPQSLRATKPLSLCWGRRQRRSLQIRPLPGAVSKLMGSTCPTSKIEGFKESPWGPPLSPTPRNYFTSGDPLFRPKPMKTSLK